MSSCIHPGGSGSVVKLQTPLLSFVMVPATPGPGGGFCPSTETLWACGARTRNVTRPSADTSGDFTLGWGDCGPLRLPLIPRPPDCAVAAGCCAARSAAPAKTRQSPFFFMTTSLFMGELVAPARSQPSPDAGIAAGFIKGIPITTSEQRAEGAWQTGAVPLLEAGGLR